MADMVADMRRRFLVAALFSVPVLLWSPIGRDVIGFNTAAPFGFFDDVFMLLLSVPVIFIRRGSSSTVRSGRSGPGRWTDGRRRRRRRRRCRCRLAVLARRDPHRWRRGVLRGRNRALGLRLLGHWFEMRARGGANDAIRALLDRAPPMATMIRDGQPIEVPTGEVVVDDILLVRPGSKIAADGIAEEGRRTSKSRWSPARASRCIRSPATR